MLLGVSVPGDMESSRLQGHPQFMKIEITIVSAPRTKKTSNRLVWAGGRQRVLPSKPFEDWNKGAQWQIAKWKSENRHTKPIESSVNCRAIFYRDAERGDAVGYYQSIADALQEAGIIKNDSQVKSWDGSRLRKDALNPRIELIIEDYVE